MKVNNGKYLSMNTCDYCFATIHEESGHSTVISKNLKFRKCTRCKVVHYCSKVSLPMACALEYYSSQ
jgi:hypothetical protein